MVTQNQKRQRQKQSRQARQAALVAARHRRNRRNRVIVSGFLALIVVVGVLVVVGGGTNSSKDTATGKVACPKADGSSPQTMTFPAAPTMCIDPAKTYTAEITTNKGTMVAALDPRVAPKTVNNFVFLSRYHFFDGLTFHRVSPGFVLQGGDPKGDGSGGPGYSFPDELPAAGQYKVGSLAMANSGPDTNGSQFFVISGDKGAQLPPKYSLFGQIGQGLDVVTAIDALGTATEKPSEPVTIQSVKIKES